MTKIVFLYIFLTTSIAVQMLSLSRLARTQLLQSKVNVPGHRRQQQHQALLLRPPVLLVRRLHRVPRAHHLNLQQAQACLRPHLLAPLHPRNHHPLRNPARAQPCPRLHLLAPLHLRNPALARPSPPSPIILCLRVDATKITASELSKISIMLTRPTRIVTVSWQHLFPLRLRLEFQPT
jgi:hypothetical protein